MSDRYIRNREIRKECLAVMKADPDDPRHGTNTGYVYGCRCDRCKEARRLYGREYRALVKKRGIK